MSNPTAILRAKSREGPTVNLWWYFVAAVIGRVIFMFSEIAAWIFLGLVLAFSVWYWIQRYRHYALEKKLRRVVGDWSPRLTDPQKKG